eukprot:357794-Chlamydomonas_euryale.AAC.16
MSLGALTRHPEVQLPPSSSSRLQHSSRLQQHAGCVLRPSLSRDKRDRARLSLDARLPTAARACRSTPFLALFGSGCRAAGAASVSPACTRRSGPHA